MMLPDRLLANVDDINISQTMHYLDMSNAVLGSPEIKQLLQKCAEYPLAFSQYLRHFISPFFSEFQKLIPESFSIKLAKYHNYGGDFFWYTRLNDIIYVAVADCTGHALSGTFLSVLGVTLLERAVHSCGLKYPAEILKFVDTQLKRILSIFYQDKIGMWGMEMALVKIDFSKNMISYAGANRPLYLVKNNTLRIIQPVRRGLGFRYATQQTFKNFSDKINNGISIYLFTDGIVNQLGGPLDKKFMSVRLQHLVLKNNKRKSASQEQVFRDDFTEWKGTRKQTDDALLVGFKL